MHPVSVPKKKSEVDVMSKYDPLWNWIKENGTDSFQLTYAEIEKITGLVKYVYTKLSGHSVYDQVGKYIAVFPTFVYNGK